jgi:hypothetical protein
MIPLPNWSTNDTLDHDRAGNAMRCSQDIYSPGVLTGPQGGTWSYPHRNEFGHAPLPRPYGPRDMEELQDPFYLEFGSSEFRPNYHRNYEPVYQDASSPLLKNRFGPNDGPNDVAYRQPFNMYEYGAGSNTIDFLKDEYYLPQGKPITQVQKNYNPTGYLSNLDNNYTPKHMYHDTGIESLGSGFGSGYIRLAQPMDLYGYQNGDYGSYNYPEFLGPRAWYGGFGKRKRKAKPREGDELYLTNGKIKIRRRRRNKRR